MRDAQASDSLETISRDVLHVRAARLRADSSVREYCEPLRIEEPVRSHDRPRNPEN